MSAAAVAPTLRPVPVTKLRAVARWAPKPEVGRKGRRGGPAGIDRDAFLEKYAARLEVLQEKQRPGMGVVEVVCPFNEEHNRGEAALFFFASGAAAFRCLHESCDDHDWRALRELLGDIVPEADRIGGLPASVQGGQFVWHRQTAEGEVVEPLFNGTFRVMRDIERDDGAERVRLFRIEGKLAASGESLPPVDVPAGEFGSMGWITREWGMQAIVYPGFATKDRLRAVAQAASADAPRSKVYGHTGWREIDGTLAYLHAGGAIGAGGPVEGVEVDLPESLSRLELPAPPTGAALKRAIKASLRLLDVGPDEVTVPLHAAVWLAILGGDDS